MWMSPTGLGIQLPVRGEGLSSGPATLAAAGLVLSPGVSVVGGPYTVRIAFSAAENNLLHSVAIPVVSPPSARAVIVPTRAVLCKDTTVASSAGGSLIMFPWSPTVTLGSQNSYMSGMTRDCNNVRMSLIAGVQQAATMLSTAQAHSVGGVALQIGATSSAGVGTTTGLVLIEFMIAELLT